MEVYWDNVAHTTQACSGATKWFVTEIDVRFNDDYDPTWHYGGGAVPSGGNDFRSVSLHEMGHGLQLGHVIDNNLVMHYSLTTGTSNASIHANELAGAQWQINESESEARCGQTLFASTSCSAPPVASFDADATITCTSNGNTINFTNTSTFPTYFLCMGY